MRYECIYSCLEVKSKILLMSSDPRSCTVVHVEGIDSGR